MIKGLSVAVVAAALLVSHEWSAAGADYSAIVVERAWARPMPPGSDVGAGYVVIRNEGEAPERLVSASSARADRMEIHETTVIDDVMRMRPVPDGVEIAPGETLELRPGALHIMFLGVAEPFAAGEEVPGLLVFEQAGERDIVFEVEARPATAPHGAEEHDGHGSHGGTHH